MGAIIDLFRQITLPVLSSLSFLGMWHDTRYMICTYGGPPSTYTHVVHKKISQFLLILNYFIYLFLGCYVRFGKEEERLLRSKRVGPEGSGFFFDRRTTLPLVHTVNYSDTWRRLRAKGTASFVGFSPRGHFRHEKSGSLIGLCGSPLFCCVH